VHFSVAHSHELAAYAVTADRAVGIDVEYVRPLDAYESIAQLILSAEEALEFGALHEREKLRAFFGYWTRKEAYVKATGAGMTAPLRQIDVTGLHPDQPFVTIEGKPPDARQWRLQDIACPDGYAAAIAVESGFSRVIHRSWPILS
jgi:4'-phosphopantetheinyl transferase